MAGAGWARRFACGAASRAGRPVPRADAVCRGRARLGARPCAAATAAAGGTGEALSDPPDPDPDPLRAPDTQSAMSSWRHRPPRSSTSSMASSFRSCPSAPREGALCCEMRATPLAPAAGAPSSAPLPTADGALCSAALWVPHGGTRLRAPPRAVTGVLPLVAVPWPWWGGAWGGGVDTGLTASRPGDPAAGGVPATSVSGASHPAASPLGRGHCPPLPPSGLDWRRLELRRRWTCRPLPLPGGGTPDVHWTGAHVATPSGGLPSAAVAALVAVAGTDVEEPLRLALPSGLDPLSERFCTCRPPRWREDRGGTTALPTCGHATGW